MNTYTTMIFTFFLQFCYKILLFLVKLPWLHGKKAKNKKECSATLKITAIFLHPLFIYLNTNTYGNLLQQIYTDTFFTFVLISFIV